METCEEMKTIYYFVKLCYISLLLSFNNVLSLRASLRLPSLSIKEHVIENFKLGLHTVLETARIRRIRSKTEHKGASSDLPFRLSRNNESISEIVVEWSIVHMNGTENIFAITEDGTISIFQDFNLEDIFLSSPHENISSLLGFQNGNRLWLVSLLVENGNQNFIQAYEYDMNTLKRRQQIPLPGRSLISLVNFKGTTYISSVSDFDIYSVVRLYVWTGTQFDLHASHRLTGSWQTFSAWETSSLLFVAVSFHNNNVMEILQFSKYGEQLTFLQAVEGNFQILKPFQVAGSQYLLCVKTNIITLYWWSGVRYLKQQEISDVSSDVIVDISIITLFEDVMIIVAKNDRLEYYVQDSVVSYMKTGSTLIGQKGSLKSIVLWNYKDTFYLLPVFHDQPTHMFQLDFAVDILAPTIEMSALEICLEDLNSSLVEIHENIDTFYSRMDDIWLTEIEQDNLTLFVEGNVVSKDTASISELSFLNSPPVPFIENLQNTSRSLTFRIDDLKASLENTVFKSGQQNISGNKTYYGAINVSTAHIGSLNENTSINSVTTLQLASALKVKGTQLFSHAFSFDRVKVHSADVSSINKQPITDYLLLKNVQIVDGNLSMENVSLGDLSVNQSINSLHVTDFVTLPSCQNLNGTKTMQYLNASTINSQGFVGEVNTSELKRIVLDNTVHFEKLQFGSKLTLGNLSFQSIGGYNITHLISHSVKKSDAENFTGLANFYQPIYVTKLEISGMLNNINLNQMITLNTSQLVNGDLNFSSISMDELGTTSINNVDLFSGVVLKFSFSEVNQTVKFLEDLRTTEISMNDKASLNDLDFLKILLKSEQSFNNSVVIDNINVTNDLRVSDKNVLGVLLHLSEECWLKKKNQNLTYGHFKQFDVQELRVNKLNGMLIKDFILLNGVDTIDSAKSFQDIEVKSLMLRNGRTLNDLDFTSKHWVARLEREDFLKVANLSVNGNLALSVLNSMDVTNVMKVDGLQECTGTKMFKEVNLAHVMANKLDLQFINKRSFAHYLYESVNLHIKRNITNKTFNQIKASNMNHCGKLNGRKLKELLKSTVMLNKKQEIKSHTQFSDGFSTKQLLSNNFNFANFSDIIFKDELEYNTRNKEFQRLRTENINLLNAINYVNISNLVASAFYKEKNNHCVHMITFKSDVHIQKFYLTSSVDGIFLQNATKLETNTSFNKMNLSSTYLKNINIHGKLNECNVLELDGLMQQRFKVKAPKYLNRMVIDGNLFIKNKLNSINDGFLNIISYTISTTFVGVFNFSKISVKNLELKFTADSIDVDALRKDVVTKQSSVVIEGNKTFKKGLTVTSLTTDSLNVTFLSDIKMPLLFGNYLSKTIDQTISIAASVPGIKARNIAIEGIINDLKLPDDLVLIDEDERISSPVFINVSVHFVSLNVSGKVDGINISQLIREKVSLKEYSNVSSPLNFLKDAQIKGNLEVNHATNGLGLNETVKKRSKNLISGFVKFHETVVLKSHLHITTGFINDISLQNLSGKMYQNHKDEHIKELVKFSKIELPSLAVDNLNNISIKELWDQIHDVEETTYLILTVLSDFVYENENKLNSLKEYTKVPWSGFGYFTLHQVLNVKSTRVLPLFESGIFGDTYELPTLQLAMWVDQNKTCRKFRTYIMDITPEGTLEMHGNFNGRMFPFTLRILEEEVEGFLLHADRTKRCSNNTKRSDLLKTIYIDEEESKFKISSPPGSILLNAKLLEMEQVICILIAYEFEGEGDRLHLYQFDRDAWLLHQKFHPWAMASFDVVFMADPKGDAVYLAVTGTGENSGIYLYDWDALDELFYLRTSFPKTSSNAVLWVSNNQDLFLILAKEKTSALKDHAHTDLYTEPLEIHVLENDIELRHVISLQGIHSLERFNLEGETYILAISRHLQSIYIIQHRGNNGFQVIQEIMAPGVESATVFKTVKKDLLLAISSRTGHTKLLKCVIRGGRIDKH